MSPIETYFPDRLGIGTAPCVRRCRRMSWSAPRKCPRREHRSLFYVRTSFNLSSASSLVFSARLKASCASIKVFHFSSRASFPLLTTTLLLPYQASYLLPHNLQF